MANHHPASDAQRIGEIRALGRQLIRDASQVVFEVHPETAPGAVSRLLTTVADAIAWLLQRAEASAVALAEKEQEIARWRNENAALRMSFEILRRERIGEVWIWQGDADDHPESLACPVLMSAEDVRAFVADRNALTTNEAWKLQGMLNTERDRVESAESALAAERLRASEALNDALLNGTNAMLAAKAEIARLASQLAGVRELAQDAVREWRLHGQLTDSCRHLEAALAALPAVQAQPETGARGAETKPYLTDADAPARRCLYHRGRDYQSCGYCGKPLLGHVTTEEVHNSLAVHKYPPLRRDADHD